MSQMKNAQIEIEDLVADWLYHQREIKKIIDKISKYDHLFDYIAPCKCDQSPGLLRISSKVIGCLNCGDILLIEEA